jgi:hypothetical protein
MSAFGTKRTLRFQSVMLLLTQSGHRLSILPDWVISRQRALLLHHHHHRYQARNRCRRTLGIAAHRPHPFQ